MSVMTNVIPLSTEEEKITVDVSKGGKVFTKEHLKTFSSLRNTKSYPKIYGSQAPKGVRYTKSTILNDSQIDCDNKYFMQLARVGINPEKDAIEADITYNGYSLAEVPILVMETSSGKYVILEGRTRYYALRKLGVTNFIVDVFEEMTPAQALRFAVLMNSEKKPFGASTWLDVQKAILKLIEFGEIEKIQDSVDGRDTFVNSVIYEIGLMSTKLTANQINLIVHQAEEAVTGVKQVKSFPNGEGATDWLEENGYVDSVETIYVPIATMVKNAVSAINTKMKNISDKVTEVRFVVHGGVLGGTNPESDWKKYVLNFDKNFREYEDAWISNRLEKGATRKKNLVAKIYGAIPMVESLSHQYPMDRLVKFKLK